MNQVVEHDRLLDEAIALAATIASNDRRAVRNLKRAYDEGAMVTMAEGLKLEHDHATEHMTSVSPADIAARRAEVQARNRQQSG